MANKVSGHVNIAAKAPSRERVIKASGNEAVNAAKEAGLIYVSDSDPGFTRIRRDSGFNYKDGNRRLRDRDHLERIRRLVLPPAWENVWICKLHNGHLQATGRDKAQRKQYRYHERWTALRNETKFFRLLEFGKSLPLIRKRIDKDMAQNGLPLSKVLATMVSLLERLNIRVGNAFYEKLYGSFGLTTLKDHHAKINGTNLKLMFKGKKGIIHNLTLRSARLVRIVQGCKDIPGKELFQYYDEHDEIKAIDSGMVNNYIREISGNEFTAKDFRTWAGTIQAIDAFREVGSFNTVAEMNKKIPAALDIVARRLGNTRTVCRKYYVHPIIIQLYQEGNLLSYSKSDKVENGEEDVYTDEEKLLMKILERSSDIKQIKTK
ncbi:MAG TPA: DNA topoisomerase IB [Bacteroidales bacterium]|nr:DNA topoisomerase IB [Bacteroidales bacterium]